MFDGEITRRELLRRGGDLGGADGPALAAERGHRSCRSGAGRRCRRGRADPGPQRLPIDRRPAADQRARHVHHHQRIDDAARGAGGDGRGIAALRPPRRADGRDRRAPRGAHRCGVGHGELGLRGRPDPRHRGLRRRRQPRSPRPHPEPARLSRRTKSSSRPTRATSTTPPSAPSACASSRCRRWRSSRRRSARAPR